MSPEDVVARLDKVRQTGSSRWTACCPAHDDKNPSLTISQGEDGRVLIHCFSGCGIDAIAAALNLDVSDFMPERLPGQRYKPIRKPFPAADVLEMLRTEATIIWLAGCDMSKGIALTEEQKARLDLAASRFEAVYG